MKKSRRCRRRGGGFWAGGNFRVFACKHVSRRNFKRRRREGAIAEGKKPLPTMGSGERRKLPSGVRGGDPETDAILNISCQNGVHFGMLLISYIF